MSTPTKRVKAARKAAKKKKLVLPKGMADHETPVPFTENFKWTDAPNYGWMTFDTDSYYAWVKDAMPWVTEVPSCQISDAKEKGIKIGNCVLYRRPLPMWHITSPWGGFVAAFSTSRVVRRCTLPIYRGETKRHIAFSRKTSIVTLANPVGKPWMSLSPNEILTQRGQVRRAKGDVAMAGMGLGWAARRVLQRPKVKHLTVYEKNEDIATFFGEKLQEEFGDRFNYVVGDAYEADWMQHDVGLWDIWPGWGGAGWDRKYIAIREEMRAAGKVCVGWGEGVHRDAY